MIKNLMRMGLLLLIAGMLLSGIVVQAQTAVSAALLEEFEAVIENEMAYYHIPGAAVAIIEGDTIAYARGFGVRDLAADEPFTTETRFRVGSTTKSMTSMLIAQLVDEGLVEWDTPVTDLLPAFATGDPDLTAQITLRDLMGMATGLVSSPTDGIDWGAWDIDRLLTAIARQSIDGDFRQSYSYNNEVYALAGYAGTLAAGREATLADYTALMQERIFDRIGLPSAIITDDMSVLGDNYSQSYERSILDDNMLLMPNPPIGIVAPAGAVWMNIEDMSRYVITQMNGGVTPEGTRIVSETVLTQTWQPSASMDSGSPDITDMSYGMGWVTMTYHGIPIRFHDGGWAGYHTQMMILPEDNTAIVVFANGSLGGLFGQTLIYAFGELLHELEATAVAAGREQIDAINLQIAQARTLISGDIADSADLVGQYEEGWSIEQRENGSLWFKHGGWESQIGYIEMLQQYVLLTGGLNGVTFSMTEEGETITLVVEVGESVSLPLRKLD